MYLLQLLDARTKGKQTDKKRFFISILAVRHAYKCYKLADVGHMRGFVSQANGLIKLNHIEVLDE